MSAGIPAGTLSIEIVAEIARLQADMDKVKSTVGAMSTDVARKTKAVNDNIASLGTTSRLAGHHTRNLMFQFNDLGIQMAAAAGSSEPLKMALMALAQQGSQIGGIMSQAGIGVGGLAKEVGGMAGRFALAHPFLTAFAIAAAGAASAVALFTKEMNATRKADIDAFTQSLGLTKEEMEKLGPVTVTATDVIKGLGRTIEEYLGIKVEDILDRLKSMMSAAFKAIASYSMTATAAIWAGFAGTYDAVRILWGKLPQVIGDAAYSAANLVISGLNYLLQKGTAYINAWSGLINAVMSKIPGFSGAQIGMLTAPQIAEMANPFKGAAASVAGDVAAAYSSRFGQAMAGQRGFFARVGENAFEAMKERVGGEAQELIDKRKAKDAGAKAGKDAGDSLVEEFMKSADKLNADIAGRLAVFQKGLGTALKPLLDAQDAEWARFGERLSAEANEGVAAISELADAMALLRDVTLELDFGSVFGQAGDSLVVMADAVDRLALATTAYANAKDAAAKIKDIEQREVALKNASAKYTEAKVAGTVQLLGATKRLFAEQSAGYKAVEAAEKAAAAVAMVQTAVHVAKGAAKIFSSLGPWAFPVVGAMMAVMAGLGFSGGSSSQAAPTSAEDLQAAAGTGSVLGDTAAKSESIANALELVAENTNKDLEYTNGMLIALRSIDLNIRALAGNVAKQISVSGSMFDTTALRLGQSGKSGVLGIGGSSTTRELYDLGVNLASGSVADIIANGISGSTYQIVQQVKKKNGVFGIGGGTKTTYQTTMGAIDGDITSSIVDVITSLRNGLVEASRTVGIVGAEALLDGFQISLGKISFADMTGQEIEDQLNAIFSKVGDDMAGTILPSLVEMQQIGEGLFETFVRVAREYQVVETALKSIGMSFGQVGVASLKARDELVQLFGSLDEFVSATEFFGDKFLSDAERLAPIAKSVREELARLGLSGVATRDQFKAAVQGLDLSTSAGRELYAALLAIAPAFDKVAKASEDAAKTMSDAFKKTVTEFEGYAASLTKYRDSLRAGELAQGNTYARARTAFLKTAGLAASGDAGGLAGLENAGKTFLSAARDNAGSLLDYQRDVARVVGAVDKGIFAATATADYAQLQLDALEHSASILASIDAGIANVQTLLMGGTPVTVATVNHTAAPASPAAVQSNAELLAEVRALRAEQARLQTQMVENGNQMNRLLSRWDGDGLLVRTDEDTPLQVEVV